MRRMRPSNWIKARCSPRPQTVSTSASPGSRSQTLIMKSASALPQKDGLLMNASRVEDEFAALECQYKSRYERVLVPLSGRLDLYLRDVVRDYPRLDRVSVRAK